MEANGIGRVIIKQTKEEEKGKRKKKRKKRKEAVNEAD